MLGRQQRIATATNTSDDGSATSPALLFPVLTFFAGQSPPLSIAGRFSVRACECTSVSLSSGIVVRDWFAGASRMISGGCRWDVEGVGVVELCCGRVRLSEGEL
jgi:hypothetical protein